MDAHQSRPSTAAREGAMVTILLETNDTEYKVYKALLIEHSEYFKKALTGPWQEAKDRIVGIADVESYTFDVFVDWLHTQRLPESDQHWYIDPEDGRKTAMAYVQAYVFGDRFQAEGFKDAMGQKLFDEFVQQVPFYETINYAYTHLPEDDALLQLMVKVQCAYWTPESDTDQEMEDRKRLPNDFLIRVMIRFSELGAKVPLLRNKH